MRILKIDPKSKSVTEMHIEPSWEAASEVIGGGLEEATRFENGDLLLVDNCGVMKHDKSFDVGAHQPFAGPGVITGKNARRDAESSLAAIQALVTFGGRVVLPKPQHIMFASLDEALAHLCQSEPSHDEGIHLHHSLIDMTDRDLDATRDDDCDEGLSPHIEMFAKSGTTELIVVPAEFPYRITSEGIRWHVPNGTKAYTLRKALEEGAPLRYHLERARIAVIRDEVLLATCRSVANEIEALK
jgi:hypothetical protein